MTNVVEVQFKDDWGNCYRRVRDATVCANDELGVMAKVGILEAVKFELLAKFEAELAPVRDSGL